MTRSSAARLGADIGVELQADLLRGAGVVEGRHRAGGRWRDHGKRASEVAAGRAVGVAVETVARQVAQGLARRARAEDAQAVLAGLEIAREVEEHVGGAGRVRGVDGNEDVVAVAEDAVGAGPAELVVGGIQRVDRIEGFGEG